MNNYEMTSQFASPLQELIGNDDRFSEGRLRCSYRHYSGRYYRDRYPSFILYIEMCGKRR